jgi:hypothetical protein
MFQVQRSGVRTIAEIVGIGRPMGDVGNRADRLSGTTGYDVTALTGFCPVCAVTCVTRPSPTRPVPPAS